MSPALVPLVSALDRVAELISAGRTPAQALKQTVREIEEYEKKHTGERIGEHRIVLGEKPMLNIPGKAA